MSETLHNTPEKDLYYVAVKLLLRDGQKRVDLTVLRHFLNDYVVLTLDSVDFEWAFNNVSNDDFENALQLSVAIRNGCNSFITFDEQLADTYANLKNISVQLLS